MTTFTAEEIAVRRARNALRAWERVSLGHADASSADVETARMRYVRERSAAREALRIAEGLRVSAGRSGVYYVSATRGEAWVPCAGPYVCHEDALRAVPRVRDELKRRGYDLLRVALGTMRADAPDGLDPVLRGTI